jgi:hypothetical protein
MPASNKLLAWIESQSDQKFTAAFVSAPTASRRAPATRSCSSPEEARGWIEREAAVLGIPVEWTDPRPQWAE